MDCRDAIMTRRSVRAYQPDPIPEDILGRIMGAACSAPSALNLQPWYFVVIQSPEPMAKLLELMAPAPQRLDAELTQRFPNHPQVVADTKRFVQLLGGAPVCVLAFLTGGDTHGRSQSTLLQSVAAATENLLLAAWNEGVASCWLTAPLEAGLAQEIYDAFAPEQGELTALITLGYPEKIPQAPKAKSGRYIVL
ncbi:nitroreductase family protein [Pseudoflavonifractor phocaeensis]|uniref:nitroreductase family protein n=1 Tax=Pseudoflavonifractor phocaeensis TaxID=1870988 RepID=UPI00195892F5|nr:nitroreductase family protein [Pseudoflavonifractor phocaeensis]MBM6924708.1 nitroreductase family protein [Pseudoflavonifractor phocaeensis]